MSGRWPNKSHRTSTPTQHQHTTGAGVIKGYKREWPSDCACRAPKPGVLLFFQSCRQSKNLKKGRLGQTNTNRTARAPQPAHQHMSTTPAATEVLLVLVSVCSIIPAPTLSEYTRTPIGMSKTRPPSLPCVGYSSISVSLISIPR